MRDLDLAMKSIFGWTRVTVNFFRVRKTDVYQVLDPSLALPFTPSIGKGALPLQILDLIADHCAIQQPSLECEPRLFEELLVAVLTAMPRFLRQTLGIG